MCVLDDSDPDYALEIGCFEDYNAVASPPLSTSIPGTLSAKTVIDRIDDNALYFQNSRKFQIHYDFASSHLSGDGLPLVTDLAAFNSREYYSSDRRFILGALNFYEGPGVWAYEIAPYDSADKEMIETAFRLIKRQLYAGDELTFHPTSDAVEMESDKLLDDIPISTTEDLFKGIDYQPLNLATSYGRLRFFRESDIENQHLTFRDIAVLESIPNDLSACVGTITAEFQTPLSHINVLAQNRGTPNMGLRGAFDDPDLRALDGRWVKLTVGAQDYSVERVTRAEADAWWEEFKPEPIEISPPDLEVTDLRDIEEVLDIDGLGLQGALAAAIPAFGGKASHYGAFPHISETEIPYPKAFVVPIYYYRQFMEQNEFDERVEALLDDADFMDDPAYREQALDALRDDMKTAPVDPDFELQLLEKLNQEYEGVRLRFRSSTNCEDLGGFSGAGLYTSKTGDPNDPTKSYLDAVRKVWASVWRFRAFEEREYRSISHQNVGMALLVHQSFPAEDANGVAITANIFDTAGLEPGYYINVQKGDTSVVLPDSGTTSDQLIYFYDMPRQPVMYLDHSSLMPEGETVLTRSELAELAEALSAVHGFFAGVYGPATPDHFYALDVEFKFNTYPDDPEEISRLVIKQARPYPGRGGAK